MPLEAYGDKSDIRFERITIEEGLSQGSISSIIQDNKGYMWFGTYDGLNRYDGYKFKTYKNISFNKSTLSSNGISCLYEDGMGLLWIGTREGLNSYNTIDDKFTHYLHNPTDPYSLSDDTIGAILEDRRGNLWIGTRNGLNRFDRETGKFIRYFKEDGNTNSLSDNSVYSLTEDKEGLIWIGTHSGLSSFDFSANKFTRYKNESENPNSLSNDSVFTIYEDSLGNLWMGTREGLNRFEKKTQRFIRYLHDENNPSSISADIVQKVYEDSLGNLWIGTDRGGLNRFDRKTEEFISYKHDSNNIHSIGDNDITFIYEDMSGMIWVGTYNNGISKFNPKPDFIHYKPIPNEENSINDKRIFSIFEDEEGILWLGTFDGGLNRMNRETGEVKHYTHNASDSSSISSNTIRKIFQDSQGNLWIGTDNGLNRFDRETERFTRYLKDPKDPSSLVDNMIKDIYEDSEGYLWIGMKEGLDVFHPDKGVIIHYNEGESPDGLSDRYVRYVYEDSKKRIWIGTVFGGLNRFDRETGIFTHYRNDPKNSNSISNESIKDIHEDSSGFLWIATNNGLNKFDPEKEIFTLYTEENGLPNNYIYGILEDSKGNLWLSTNNGISRFDITTNTFRNFHTSDGLQGNEFNVNAFFKSKSGEMFFGGTNGFNSFFPEKLVKSSNVSQLVINDFKIFDESETLDESNRLSYKENFFSFEFALLDFKNPLKNQYAYMLEGFDKDWIYSGTRSYASYTNLDGGSYVFKVKGANSNGIWQEDNIAVNIVVDRPPWKRWWAYCIYFILGALGLALILNYVSILESKVKQRTSQLNKANDKLLDEINERKMIEEKLKKNIKENRKLFNEIIKNEKFKNDFFVNLSHELRTPLNIILGTLQLTDIFLEKNHADIKGSMSRHVSTIRKNSYSLLKVVNNLIDTSKIESGQYRLNFENLDIVYLIEELILSIREYASQRDIGLVFDTDVEEKIVGCDPVEVERIILNLVSNAIKFTPEGGNILITIFDEDEKVKISVKDDGIGIPKDKQELIFKRFGQANNGYTSNIQSSGIGLSLVKSLVEMHDGTIEVISEENKGSEFIINLPVKLDRQIDNMFINRKNIEIKNIDIELSQL